MDIINNTKLSRFELEVEGTLAVVDYVLNDNVYSIPRVYVPKHLEGRGLGAKVLKSALEVIEEKGGKIVPICPFVGAYLKRHPEKNSLLA